MTHKKIQRVLIANRGEIAVRIVRTLKEMGISSVAVYSDADVDSMHRKAADLAINLPGRTAADTYLNVPALLNAMKASNADAIHPGYGFLSENSEFVKTVSEAGYTFIGPNFQSMETMGNKVTAKDLMKKHEVPTVPGSDGELHSLAELEELAANIGYPLILKAAAGGGGRGMREVTKQEELKDAYEACSREALSYFGNPSIFAERLLVDPRHIEIQVLCDGKNGVHLFERDCSIQRRHQKLIEEAPSLFLNDEQRERLGKFAVKAALAVGYQGVGTVEFICESPEKAYFMEMNTRIQVEHPVSEMITGIDLVREQIRVANGESLTMTQDDIQLNGWSFEARINAEDATMDFMPKPGEITNLHLPMGPFTRVDTHIYEGYKVPEDYDSMIAKVITWGPTRDLALERLKRSLAEMEIGGIPTTARFHEAIIDHNRFRSGEFTTSFVVEEYDSLQKAMQYQEGPYEKAGAFAAIAVEAKSGSPKVNTDFRRNWAQQAIADGNHQT